jgi:hypothetical protein
MLVRLIQVGGCFVDNVKTVLLKSLRNVNTFLVLSALAAAQQSVSFPTQDGGVIYADMYGKGRDPAIPF